MNHPYVEQTLHAVRDICEVMARYRGQLHESVSKGRSTGEYMARKASVDALAGSVLQIGYAGIQIYCEASEPPDWGNGLKWNGSARKCCRGRIVRNVSLGLAIYAGRNQYNHLDDTVLSELNRAVFDRMARGHGVEGFEDTPEPPLDLENESILNYASNVLWVIEWQEPDRYVSDMNDLLGGI